MTSSTSGLPGLAQTHRRCESPFELPYTTSRRLPCASRCSAQSAITRRELPGMPREDSAVKLLLCKTRRYQRLKFRHNLYKLREERSMKPSTFGEMVSSMLYEKRCAAVLHTRSSRRGGSSTCPAGGWQAGYKLWDSACKPQHTTMVLCQTIETGSERQPRLQQWSGACIPLERAPGCGTQTGRSLQGMCFSPACSAPSAAVLEMRAKARRACRAVLPPLRVANWVFCFRVLGFVAQVRAVLRVTGDRGPGRGERRSLPLRHGHDRRDRDRARLHGGRHRARLALRHVRVHVAARHGARPPFLWPAHLPLSHGALGLMVAGTAPDSLYGMCESMWRPDMVRAPLLVACPSALVACARPRCGPKCGAPHL